MPCSFDRYLESRAVYREKLATEGWSPEEIDRLDKEVELAARKAEAQAYTEGRTKSEQERAMELAAKKAQKIAHDRMHAMLGDYMHQINSLKKAIRIEQGQHS